MRFVKSGRSPKIASLSRVPRSLLALINETKQNRTKRNGTAPYKNLKQRCMQRVNYVAVLRQEA